MRKTPGFMAAMTALVPLSQAAAQQQDEGLQEIIVTAQKREQSLQDVPISATVLSSAALEQAGVTDVEDLILLAPNLSMQSNGYAGQLNLTIRGVQNLGGQVNSYGVYLDEFNLVPSGLTITVDPSLLDVERVEVLRGPQGVAFGRNVIGGAISLVSKKPGKVFESEVAAGVSRYGTWRARGAIGGPLSDKVGLRFSGYGAHSDGFIENIGSADDTNDYDRYGGRITLRMTPTENATIDVAVDHSTDKFGLQSNVPSAIVHPDAAGLASIFGVSVPSLNGQGTWPSNRNRVATDYPAHQKLEKDLVQLNASFGLGRHTLSAVAGYLDARHTNAEDADFTNGSYTVHLDDDKLRSSSLELRLAGPVTDRFDYLVGALYSRDVSETGFQFLFGPDGFAALNALLDNFINPGLIAAGEAPLPYFDLSYQQVNYSPTRLETRSKALFFDTTWRITPRTQLLAGLRATRDDTESAYTRGGMFLPSAFFAGQLIPFETTGTGSADHTAITPRVALNFAATDDVNLYLSATRGYKSGGFNSAALATALQGGVDLTGVELAYDPEYAWAYEAGAKTELFERRLRLNAALFYTKWTDLQVDVFNLQAFSSLTLNAAKASLRGAEVDFAAKLGPHWDLSGGLGALDAKFDDFPLAQFGGVTFDATGNKLPTAPKLTGSVALQYSTPLSAFASTSAGDMRLFARGDYAYQGSRYADITNDSATRLDSYGVAGFSVGLENGRMRTALFVQNAFDKNYYTGYSGDVPFSGYRVDVHPRIYGVDFRYQFQ